MISIWHSVCIWNNVNKCQKQLMRYGTWYKLCFWFSILPSKQKHCLLVSHGSNIFLFIFYVSLVNVCRVWFGSLLLWWFVSIYIIFIVYCLCLNIAFEKIIECLKVRGLFSFLELGHIYNHTSDLLGPSYLQLWKSLLLRFRTERWYVL